MLDKDTKIVDSKIYFNFVMASKVFFLFDKRIKNIRTELLEAREQEKSYIELFVLRMRHSLNDISAV